MKLVSVLRTALAAALLWLLGPLAQAGYLQWDVVELPASSGASCGNGTPYRFFVNRSPFNKDTVVMYEGGGACWDQKSCLGQGKLSATNANGVPADYLTRINAAAAGLVTPFTARLDPFQEVRTDLWTLVYLPYCTGDVHTGSKVVTYSDADPANPRVQWHRGQANIRAAATWLRNNLGRPNQLLVSGFSAGGTGATATYPLMRDTLKPTGRASLLADSGPLFSAPRSGTSTQYPSLPLHNRIRSAWGLDEAGGLLNIYSGTAGFDVNDMGSVTGALALRYPGDRFAYMVFSADMTYSAFSYEKFFPEISGASSADKRKTLLLTRWKSDIARWVPTMNSFANVAYHVPFYRDFNNSHCLSIIDFSGTGIEEAGIADITPFIDNTLDRGVPMRTVETDTVSDLFRAVSSALSIFSIVMSFFG